MTPLLTMKRLKRLKIKGYRHRPGVKKSLRSQINRSFFLTKTQKNRGCAVPGFLLRVSDRKEVKTPLPLRPNIAVYDMVMVQSPVTNIIPLPISVASPVVTIVCAVPIIAYRSITTDCPLYNASV